MKMHMNQNGSAALSANRSAPSSIGALLSDAASVINVWRWRRRERRAIGQLDDHMLRDVGLSRLAAEEIAARAFWKS
jgi:uncharacterized protein YjiS (DUF1127 family)